MVRRNAIIPNRRVRNGFLTDVAGVRRARHRPKAAGITAKSRRSNEKKKKIYVYVLVLERIEGRVSEDVIE